MGQPRDRLPRRGPAGCKMGQPRVRLSALVIYSLREAFGAVYILTLLLYRLLRSDRHTCVVRSLAESRRKIGAEEVSRNY